MFVLDSLLLSPVKGFVWLCREIEKAAAQEVASEAESLTAELTQLYLRLERGEITDEQFDQREADILDRLDALKQQELTPDDTNPPDDQDTEDDE